MVADNLKRQWLCVVYFANCIRQPEEADLIGIVTTDHASLKEGTPVHQRACNNNHYLADIVENHYKSIIFFVVTCSQLF